MGKKGKTAHHGYYFCSKIFLSKTILACRTGTFPQNKTSRIFFSLLVSSSMKTKHTHMQPATFIARFIMRIWNNPLLEVTKL